MIDLIGHKFGRLTVLEKSDVPYKWLCQCQCGNKKDIPKSSLLSGDSKSCGCLNKEAAKERMKNNRWWSIKSKNNL